MFPLLTSMYQTVTDEGIGLSWESQHKRVKIVPGRNWRKLHCTTPFSTWWTPHWAEEKQTSNLADPDFQVPANREKKCGSKHKRGIFTNTRQFPTREGNSPSSLPCEPCNYVSKKMELCLQIQQITKNKFKKATNRQLAIHIGSVTTPNGWFRHRSQLECKSVTTTHWHTVQKKILTTLWTKKRGDVLWLNARLCTSCQPRISYMHYASCRSLNGVLTRWLVAGSSHASSVAPRRAKCLLQNAQECQRPLDPMLQILARNMHI